LILSLLTRELGKVAVVARGAKNSRKRFFGGLDIFSSGIFEISQAKKSSSLQSIQQINERQIWTGLRENLLAFAAASSAIETTSSLVGEGDPDGARFFSPLFLCLKNLDSADTDIARLLTLSFFLAQAHELAGLGEARNISTLESDASAWLAEMKEKKTAFEPLDSRTLTSSLLCLRLSIEEFLGKRIMGLNPVFSSLERQTS